MSLPSVQSQTEENQTIKQLREAREQVLEELKAEREAKEKLIQEHENAKLSENEKREKELEELRAEKARLEAETQKGLKHEQVLQKLYDEELAGVPEDKRELIRTLSAIGDAGDRLSALRSAIKLAGITGTSMGNVTNPGVTTGAPVVNQPATTLDPKVKVPWTGVGGFFDPTKTVPTVADKK